MSETCRHCGEPRRAHGEHSVTRDHVFIPGPTYEALAARVVELEEALRPFAEAARAFSEGQVGAALTAFTLERIAERLGRIQGIDAAFLATGPKETTIYAVAREHGIVDRVALLEVENDLARAFGNVVIVVRAHQGKDPGSLFPGLQRISGSMNHQAKTVKP